MAVNIELLGLKTPAPPLHVPDEVGPVTEPANRVLLAFLQENKSIPAFTTGDGVK